MYVRKGAKLVGGVVVVCAADVPNDRGFLTTSGTLQREIAAEQALGGTLERFAGSWVALREHQVVADAPTLDELLRKIEGMPVEGVMQVPTDHDTVCFF